MSRIKQAFFVAAIGISVSACVSADSGVLPIGPDTYQLSVGRAPVAGGPFEARRVALTRAQEYCAQRGREFLVLNTNQWGENRGGFDLDFRCLQRGDPDLQRPTLRRSPDRVIEIRS